MSDILKTGLGLLAARFSQPVISFALFGLLARRLTLEDFAAYVLLTSLLLVFQSLASLGLPAMLTRELARTPDQAPAWAISSLVALLPAALIAWAALPLFVWTLGHGEAVRHGALILGASLPFSVAVQVGESVFLARGDAKAIIRVNLAENLARVGASLVVLLLGQGLPALLCCHAGAKALSALLTTLRLRASGDLSPGRLDFGMTRRLLAGVPVFGALVVASTLFFRIDVIVLSALASERALALYGAAYRLVSLGMLLPESFVGALYPALSSQIARNQADARRMTTDSLRALLSLGLPCCLAAAAAAPLATPLLFGSAFDEAAPLFALLSMLLPAHAVNCLLGFLLQADGRERQALLVVLAGVCLNAVLCSAGASAFGAVGAAVAVMISFGLTAALHYLLVDRRVFRLELGPSLARLALATLAGGLPLALGYGTWLAGLAPLLCAACLGLFGEYDRSRLSGMLKTPRVGDAEAR